MRDTLWIRSVGLPSDNILRDPVTVLCANPAPLDRPMVYDTSSLRCPARLRPSLGRRQSRNKRAGWRETGAAHQDKPDHAEDADAPRPNGRPRLSYAA